jgi:hypothetical protein
LWVIAVIETSPMQFVGSALVTEQERSSANLTSIGP